MRMFELPESVIESHRDRKGYDVALICLNGHDINRMATRSPKFNKKHCPRCGERATWQCEASCLSPIQGNLGDEYSTTRPPPPAFCHECGNAYPWTKRKLDATQELIEELEGPTSDERAQLIDSLPDLASDTPRSELAVLIVQRAASKLKGAARKVFESAITKVATTAILKLLGW